MSEQISEIAFPPPSCELPRKGTVHLWHFNLDSPPASGEFLQTILETEEQDRCKRLYFSEHRRRAIVARGLLRSVLGAYLHTSPAQIHFAYGKDGKPDTPGIAFNLTHSGGKALLAIAAKGRLGVDLEYVQPERDISRLARRFFSEAEKQALADAATEHRARLFHRFWVRKEALLKAAGTGLIAPLKKWDVAQLSEDAPRAGEWWIYDVEVWDEYVAAVANDECVREIRPHFF